MKMLRPRRLCVCAILATGSMFSQPTIAQTGLPVGALTLSPADQGSVRAYIQQHSPTLISGPHTQAQSARDRLVEPVLGDASVEFRLYFGQQIIPTLRDIIADHTDPWRVQLALAVAGAIATDAALELTLEAADDDRPAVRLAAAREIATLLEQADLGRAAIQQARLTAAIETLTATLAEETETLVAGEIAKALATPTRTASLQNQTLPAMCVSLAAWLDTNTPDSSGDALLEAVSITLRAVKVTREQLVRRLRTGDSPRAINDAATRLGTSAGALAQHALRDDSLSDDGRTLARRLADAAETLTDIAAGLGRR